MAIRYISIEEFSEFHHIDLRLIEEFIDFGLVDSQKQSGQPCIREEDIEPLEAMVRLHAELGVNLEGIEAIMHMRQRMKKLRARVEELEQLLNRYERLQAVDTGFSGRDNEN